MSGYPIRPADVTNSTTVTVYTSVAGMSLYEGDASVPVPMFSGRIGLAEIFSGFE